MLLESLNNLMHLFTVVEWVGKKEGERNVVIKFDSQRKKLHVNDRRGKPLRMIDLRPKQSTPGKSIRLWNADDRPVLSVRAEGEIDLVRYTYSTSQLYAIQLCLLCPPL